MSRRLLSSRLHRDLSDSVIKRFYGLPLSLTYMGLQNLISSLDKMQVNREGMSLDVEKHLEILSEAYQVYLRKQGHPEAYEVIQRVIRENPEKIVERLEDLLPKEEFKELAKLNPLEYIGEAERIVKILIHEIEEIRKSISRLEVENL
jgi:adenylosuccinate lyase